MIKIQRIKSTDLDIAFAVRILQLKNTVWPSNNDIETQYNVYLDRNRARPRRETLVARDGNTLVAHAEIFSRTIFCNEQSYEVGCLAGVCVTPQRQGEGLGKTIVQEAFSSIDNNEYQVFLFQTRVPDFYNKLGARGIWNRFINSRSDRPLENPWWDTDIMIYPSRYQWPEGVIDLNGQGY